MTLTIFLLVFWTVIFWASLSLEIRSTEKHLCLELWLDVDTSNGHTAVRENGASLRHQISFICSTIHVLRL